MIPFTTCISFNRKRHAFNQSTHSNIVESSLPEPTSPVAAQNLLVFYPKHRQLSALPSIHIDSTPWLDHSYHKITERFLNNASNWSFNSFTLDMLTGGHSLSSLLIYLFKKYDFIQLFNLDIVNVWKCFRLFEKGYHDTNPYHNSVHAADVAQAMHCFISEEKIGRHLTPMEKMCALLAAVAHDLDHPGVNQNFLIATNNHLASLYNNISVLESHHWRFAISCIKESKMFDHFTADQWKTVYRLFDILIMATDISQQAGYLKRFRDTLSTNKILDMSDAQNRLFVMQIALKCADLGNSCRPWSLSLRWTQQICEEFFRQGDYERKMKMRVTPIFDRTRATMAHIQTDFIRDMVAPLFKLWDQFLSSKLSRRIIFNLNFNNAHWLSSLTKVNVKRRHSHESVSEKRHKPRIMSKSLDDIMSIEEISLDEFRRQSKSKHEEDTDQELVEKAKKKCTGPNGCGTPSQSPEASIKCLPEESSSLLDSEQSILHQEQSTQKQRYQSQYNHNHPHHHQQQQTQHQQQHAHHPFAKFFFDIPRVEIEADQDCSGKLLSGDKMANLPHSISSISGYSIGCTNQLSPQSNTDNNQQYLKGRRGSAPGCIGVCTNCELAATAIVLFRGAVSENASRSGISRQKTSPKSPPLTASNIPSPYFKAQKRRSSFPVCDSIHNGPPLGVRCNTSKSNLLSPNIYGVNGSQRFKGRSLELLMSSLTAKSKLLNNQSCSLDSSGDCGRWVHREERRGSIPQDILINSLVNYTAAAEGL